MPNALPNYVMGRTLFDTSISFEELAREYFSAAYGDDWEKVYSYLTDISSFCSCDYLNGKGSRINPDTARNMELLLARIYSFEPVLEQHKNTSSAENLFWKQLDYHKEYSLQLGKALLLLSKGETEDAQLAWRLSRTGSAKRAFLPILSGCIPVFPRFPLNIQGLYWKNVFKLLYNIMEDRYVPRKKEPAIEPLPHSGMHFPKCPSCPIRNCRNDRNHSSSSHHPCSRID